MNYSPVPILRSVEHICPGCGALWFILGGVPVKCPVCDVKVADPMMRCVICQSPNVSPFNPFCKPCTTLIEGEEEC